MYQVNYSKRAVKELKKLDLPTARIIYGWIEKNLVNCEDPRLHGKALTGNIKGYWRYRVGTYRIIADINDSQMTICVISTSHRKDIYRQK